MAIADNRNTKIPNSKLRLLILVSVVLAGSGYFGWMKFRQEQEKNIQQAQVLLEQVCQSDIPVDSSVLNSSKKVDEAIGRLSGVPNIPGLPYQKAQVEINNFSACVKGLNAQRDFVTAKSLGKNAFLLDESKIFPIKDLQPISSDLEKAVVLLKNIPQNTSDYARFQKELKIYQDKLQQINQKIKLEESAANAFTQAEIFNQEIDDIITQRSPTIESLSEAELKLRTSIQLLEDIPKRTTISEKSQTTLTVYQKKLKDIQYKLSSKQLQPLVKKISSFASSLDASIGYHEYVKQVSDLKGEFKNLTQDSSALNIHPGAKALEKVLARYDDALIVWRYCHEGNCFNSLSAGIIDPRPVEWLPDSFAVKGVPLSKTYQVKLTSNIFRQKFIQQNEVLADIWEQAAQEIKELASTLKAD